MRHRHESVLSALRRDEPRPSTGAPSTCRPFAHTLMPRIVLVGDLAIIRATPLSDAVKERATRAFQLLGEAEAAIHSIPIEKVHFHEVGAVDTIVDIVCTAAGCEALGVDRWLARR